MPDEITLTDSKLYTFSNTYKTQKAPIRTEFILSLLVLFVFG